MNKNIFWPLLPLTPYLLLILLTKPLDSQFRKNSIDKEDKVYIEIEKVQKGKYVGSDAQTYDHLITGRKWELKKDNQYFLVQRFEQRVKAVGLSTDEASDIIPIGRPDTVSIFIPEAYQVLQEFGM